MCGLFLRRLLAALALSCLCASASALLDCSELGEGAAETKVSSAPLFIEIPDGLHQLQAVTVKLHVNNPDVRKEAKVVSFHLINQNLYPVADGKPVYESGQFQREIAYGGEQVVEFGLRNWNYYLGEDYPSRIEATFIALKPYPSDYEKYRKEKGKADSPWHGYDCKDLAGEAYCNGAKSCKGCVKEVGKVTREYPLSKTEITSAAPKSVAFTPSKDNGQPGRLDQYFEFKDESKPNCYRSYQIRVSARPDKFEDVPKYVHAGSGEALTQAAAPKGGMLGKRASELRGGDANRDMPPCGDKPYCTQPVRYEFNYHMFAEMDPPGSGMLELIVTRTDCALPDARKKAIDDSIREGQAVMTSYAAKDGGWGGFYRGKTCYWPKTGSKGGISGRITDGHGHPMQYMNVTLEYDDKAYAELTDKDGIYAISNVPGLEPDAKNPPEATLIMTLSYHRDGKNYYDVRDKYGDVYALKKTFKLKAEEDKKQDADFMFTESGFTVEADGASYEVGGLSSPAEINNQAAVYHYMGDAVEFALTSLEANIDYKLPVQVFIREGTTSYSPVNSEITISPSDLPYESTDRPKNREYHEFSHHLMYTAYRSWSGYDAEGVINHAGYINPNSGDSYLEGFAEFMAMAISDEVKGDPDLPMQPEIYAGFGSMDNNYRAWDNRGFDEEFAVAGTLWDLYSDDNDDADAVAIPVADMWRILKVKRNNFYEVYKAFKAAYPAKAKDIDGIFVEHGFYFDRNKGNGEHDDEELYIDANSNGAYDDGEIFLDYPDEFAYRQGDTIGKPANYDRPGRNMAGLIPNAFVKVPDNEVRFYNVSVHYDNASQGRDYAYRAEVREGLLYLMPLPGDVEATITVKPDSKDYTAKSPYTITNRQYTEKYDKTPQKQGYFDTHTFSLQPTGQHKDKTAKPAAEPKWYTDGGPNAKPVIPEKTPGKQLPCIPLLTAALALAAALTQRVLRI
jgi:hypothetical protein